MSGLLDRNKSTKLILFAVDDDSFLPNKKEMHHNVPDCSYNIYKAWGNFKDCFETIDKSFHIKKEGISATNNYRPERFITHAFRINTDQRPNEFFLIKYSSSLVACFELSEDHIIELEKLIKYCKAQYNLMEEMNDVINKFETGRKAVNFLSFRDKTMSNPNQKYINVLFKNYGEKAAEQLVKKVTDWQEKIKWQ